MLKRTFYFIIIFIFISSSLFAMKVSPTETISEIPPFEYRDSQVFLGYYSTILKKIVKFPYKNMSSSSDILEPVYKNINEVFEENNTIWGNHILTDLKDSYSKGYYYIGLPNNVLRIASLVFSDTDFEYVYIDNNNSKLRYIDDFAFENSKIKKIDLPKKLIKIGIGAFRNSKIEKIIIPSEINILSDFLFENCNTLISVDFLCDSDIDIGIACFRGTSISSIEFPLRHIKIGEESFRNLTGPINVSGGTSFCLDDYSFAGSIVSKFPFDLINSIGRYAFYSSFLSSSNIIFDNLTSIGDYSFADTKGPLSVVSFPMLLSIGEGAFCYSSCGSIDFYGSSFTEIPLHAFRESLIDTVYLSENVSTIGNDAFGSCLKLKKIFGTDNVKFIGDFAFYSSGLKTIDFPSLITIGAYCFANTGLTRFIFPSSLAVIGKASFKNCPLEQVVFDSIDLDLIIDSTAFAGTNYEGQF